MCALRLNSRPRIGTGRANILCQTKQQDQLDLGRYEEEDYENMNVEKMQGMGGHPANPPQTPVRMTFP